MSPSPVAGGGGGGGGGHRSTCESRNTNHINTSRRRVSIRSQCLGSRAGLPARGWEPAQAGHRCDVMANCALAEPSRRGDHPDSLSPEPFAHVECVSVKAVAGGDGDVRACQLWEVLVAHGVVI